MVDGWVHPDFAEVAKAFRGQVQRTTGGASVAVVHDGQLVVDLWGGVCNAGGDRWQGDTLSMSFSTTKGVASTAAHILADRGRLDLDAPVRDYWPEFAQSGKGEVTVRHLLTHSAGLHRIRPIIDSAERMLDWDHMTAALAAAPCAYTAGTANGYHGLTYGWLIGEVVRRVDGRDIATFVADEIAAPLDLGGLFIGCPPAERGRVAPIEGFGRRLTVGPRFARRMQKRAGARMGEVLTASAVPFDPRRVVSALVPRGSEAIWQDPRVMDAAIPAANGFFDARSLARMYGALAEGGSIDGVELLSPAAVEQMSVVQSMRRDLVLGLRMRWRLGYHGIFTSRGILDEGFGHFGFGGSGAWADPTRRLALAMTCNRGAGTPIGDARIAQLGTAALSCASQRRRRRTRR